MSRFTFTGSPACGRWPDPARVTSHPPVASARAAPWAWGRMASESPWITSTGQRTRAQPSRKLSSPHTALFTEENNRLLERQTAMYADDRPLWRRYEQACDFLEDDLDSGYVRVLQEMLAAGWSNPEIGDVVRDLLTRWYVLLADVAREAERRFGSLGPFTPEEIATLVANAFIGSEALLLLGFERPVMPIRSALRRIGVVIREREESADRTPPASGGSAVVAG